MTRFRLPFLRSAALSAIILIGASLAACAPPPEPTPDPEPTGFASEEEAFAAAEEVYRAYTEAFNRVDTSDPTTFEPVYALTSGKFEASEKENFSYMHAENLILGGEIRLVEFTGIEANLRENMVRAEVCMNVSEMTVVNDAGVSFVSPERKDTSKLEITLIGSGRNLTVDTGNVLKGAECNG